MHEKSLNHEGERPKLKSCHRFRFNLNSKIMQYLGDGIWVSDDFDEQFDFAGDADAIRGIIKEEIQAGNIKPIQDAKSNP